MLHLEDKEKIEAIKIFTENIEFLKSNKLNVSQSITFFSGLTSNLILNTKIFQKNEDLKPFIYDIFLKNLQIDQFLDYVYANRTTLIARINRIIFEKITFSHMLEITEYILEYLYKDLNDTDDENSKYTKRQLSSEKLVDEWLNYTGIKKD